MAEWWAVLMVVSMVAQLAHRRVVGMADKKVGNLAELWVLQTADQLDHTWAPKMAG